MEQGFERCQSDNLPQIDSLTMASYFASNNSYISAEIRGAKAARATRESYGDSAIGYVQIKREANICTLKARITPEHKVRKTPYHVTLIYDEKESIIENVQCHDCAASAGGCKHAIAFLSWVHRRSEEPSPTSVKCYWSKAKLSSVGSVIKFVKIKEIGETSTTANNGHTDGSFMKSVMEEYKKRNIETQISKYYNVSSIFTKLSIHLLYHSFKTTTNDLDVNLFLEYCSDNIDSSACNDICKQTIEQANSPLWHEMRYGRITASKAYEVAHCKTLNGSLVESILGGKSIKDTTAMKRGRVLEPLVLAEIKKRTGIKFKKQGIILKKNLPVFGASPDGISDDYILEIKCPINENTFKKYFDSNYNPSSRYLAQIQMQMYFADRKKSIFCIAYPDFEISKEIQIINVDYDEKYCKDLFEKCLEFWRYAVYPRICV
ncbi:hypothetical protein evm_003628 [Chilo suppressalis]|nr:hypothetical protein evm_003628 [Chilo suppressalis]